MNVIEGTDRPDPTSDPTASLDEQPSTGTALRRSTGRDRAEWFAALDTWGAAGRDYHEIAGWLTGEHRLSDWWAQKLIVEYQEARGLRGRGERPDGTFAGGASKSVAVPVDRLYEAFVDAELRERWLPGVTLHERTARPGRSARFDVGDGTRLSVVFSAAGDGRSQVAVEHERLPDAAVAEERRVFWRARLTVLKDLLESPRTQ